MSGNFTVVYSGGVDYAAVIVLPCDGIRIDGGTELCGVGCIARYGSNCRRPAIIKGISILCGCGLGRGCTFVSRCFTVSNLFSLQGVAVAVYPSDGVFVDGGFISCSVGCNTVYSLDFRSPTCKGVGVLCGCGLGRGCTVVSGYHAVFHFRGLQDRSVFVHKFDGVFVEGGRILCGVSDIAGYGRKSLVPTGEGVGVLCIGCLIGRALEARCYTVFILFCCCVAVYDPGDGVLICSPLGICKSIFRQNGSIIFELGAVCKEPACEGVAFSGGGGQCAVGCSVCLRDRCNIGNTVCNICTVLINTDIVKGYGVVSAVGIQTDLRFHNGRIVRSGKYVVPIFIAGKSV